MHQDTGVTRSQCLASAVLLVGPRVLVQCGMRASDAFFLGLRLRCVLAALRTSPDRHALRSVEAEVWAHLGVAMQPLSSRIVQAGSLWALFVEGRLPQTASLC